MTPEQLVDHLKSNDSILPQEVLQGADLHSIAAELANIFEIYKPELIENEKLRLNFTELVNYVYLSTLSQRPEERNKGIFSSQLTTFLLGFQAA